jgi:hypothetical protein
MLFSEAILQAEWEASAPFREAMAIKRVRRRSLYIASRYGNWEDEVAGSISLTNCRCSAFICNSSLCQRGRNHGKHALVCATFNSSNCNS